MLVEESLPIPLVLDRNRRPASGDSRCEKTVGPRSRQARLKVFGDHGPTHIHETADTVTVPNPPRNLIPWYEDVR